jgi:prolyl-tRNA synthetase
MRVSQLLVQHSTEHDDDLLARASYIHRVGNGLYSLLPLGNRVLQRINSIVRRELERVGAQEVTMPLLQPQWLWQQRISAGATRAEAFGPQLFHVRGGSGENLILAPTHEEMATLLGAACIRGSCDLPRIIFQIQPRFRDHDVAPRAGLLRTREFVMADAYSLHADEDGLLEGYAAMKCAFRKVLAACGVDAAAVKASSGAMGGGPSEELIAPLPKAATVTAIKCAGCGYAASLQVADFRRECPREHELLPLKEIDSLGGDGPDRARELVASASNQLSCVPFVAGRNVVLTVVPRHLLLNGDKLVAVLSQTNIDLAGFHQGSAEELTRLGGDGCLCFVHLQRFS